MNVRGSKIRTIFVLGIVLALLLLLVYLGLSLPWLIVDWNEREMGKLVSFSGEIARSKIVSTFKVPIPANASNFYIAKEKYYHPIHWFRYQAPADELANSFSD